MKELRYCLHNADVMAGFECSPDESVGLIVTSPPYNVGIEYDSWNDVMPRQSYLAWCEMWLKECYRVLKPDGRIAINIPFEANMIKSGDGRVMIVSDYWHIMEKIGFKLFGLIRLEEKQAERSKFTAWGSYMSPSCPYIYNPDECVILAYKELPKKITQGETDLTKEEFVEYVSGVWKYKAETKGLTMANFSLDIPMKAIKILSFKKDTVLDPFMGSGTTGVACMLLDRYFIGFEISPRYHAIAEDRIQYAVDRGNCALGELFE